MLSIEVIMLIASGFLLGTLVFLAIAPAYRKRTERLTMEAVRAAMPLTEDEIRAEQDRLRADYAIKLHKLQEANEKATLKTAKQRVEINRRDASIVSLNEQVRDLGTALEEQTGARQVFEKTVKEKLPKVEQRLADAKQLLMQRDDEISQLTDAAERRARALEETSQINTQNRDEIHRLQAALSTRAARNREGLGDPRFDGEVALRTELEALRAKTRDQAQLITKLQGLVSEGATAVAPGEAADRAVRSKTPDEAVSVMARLGASSALNGTGALTGNDAVAGGGASAVAGEQLAEVDRLRAELARVEAALQAANENSDATFEEKRKRDLELRRLKAANEDQGLEVKQLSSELQAYRESERRDTALAEGKMAMKARIAALQSQAEGQATTIQSLRAELAATNERLARQASYYMSEMRKLGAGRRGPLDLRNMNLDDPSQLNARDASTPRSPSNGLSELQANTKKPAVYAMAAAASDAAAEVAVSSASLGDQAAGVASTGQPAPANASEQSTASQCETDSDQPGKRKPSGLLERITRLDKSR